MRGLLVSLVVFGSLPFVLMRPYIGVLVWVWLGFMNPHRLAWGFAHDFPFAATVAVTTLLGMLLTGQWRFPAITRETLILIGLVVWMQVTTLFALNQSDAWVQNEKVLKIQFMIVVTLMLIRTLSQVRALVAVTAASIAFFGVKGGIFTIVTGGEHQVWGPDDTFIGGNNEIGLALIMTIPLLRYLQVTAPQRWLKNALFATILLCGVAILGTHSRGAVVGMAAMLCFLIWKSKYRLGSALVILITLPFALGLMPQKWFDRVRTIENYQQDESAMARINSWYFAFNLAVDRPVLGGGFEVFEPEYFAIYAPNPTISFDAHSIYFEILGEHGFIGLWLFLCLAGSTWISCSWLARQARNDPDIEEIEPLSRMVQVAMIGYGVGGAFLGLAYFDLYYNLVAIVVISKALMMAHLRTDAERRVEVAPLESHRRRPAIRSPRLQRL